MYLPWRENCRLCDQIHPLHIAASYGLPCIFGDKAVAELDIPDGQDFTPIIWVATSRQPLLVKHFLENKFVRINALNSEGRSALTAAADMMRWSAYY